MKLLAAWLTFSCLGTVIMGMEERIIGGTVVTGSDRPPFMVVFNFVPSSSIKCTASIITPSWVVTAAHCIVNKNEIFDGSCLAKYNKAKFKTVCEKQPNGDMKLQFPEQEEKSPEIFVNVDNFMEVKDTTEGATKYLLDFIISSKDSYKGGKYGDYGGYDFIIMKTRKPIVGVIPVCLPGPNYKHHNPQIGGYGRYRRVPCEVNDLGPEIYQYCKVDPKCTAKTSSFQQAKCNTTFTYQDKVYDGCIRDQETPSARDPECTAFFTATKISDKDMNKLNVNEFVILAPEGNLLTKCYRKAPGQHGWCGTTKYIIDGLFSEKEKEDNKIQAGSGWGTCTDSCEDSENVPISGKARIKTVSINDQHLCDEELLKIRKGRGNFTVFPKVFCVAFNETYKTVFYQKEQDNTYTKIEDKPELHKLILGRERPWYVRATGSCKGDSGGPLYEETATGFVLLGTTSRGLGDLSNCGGIDNPTHYVRVADMIPWIKEYIPAEELCIQDK